MVNDFRPLLAMIKAVGILEKHIIVNGLSDVEVKDKESAVDIWEIIYNSTDRNFMPDIKNINTVYHIIKHHQNGQKSDYDALDKYVDALTVQVAKLKNIGYDDRMNILIALSLLDDASGYYRTGMWNGVDYKIDTLKSRYKVLRGEIL